MNAENPAAVEFIGLWYRAGAFLWDLVIVAALTGGLVAVLVGDQLDAEHGLRMAGRLTALVVTAYTLSFWILTGTTPGKWLCSCRIVDMRSGAKPHFWQFLVRFLGYGLSAVPLLLGFVWAIWHPRRRGWHDRLARTAVIGDSSLRRPNAEERSEARFRIEPPPWQTSPSSRR